MDKSIVVHQNPIWRNQANFIISAEFPDEEGRERLEQLWVRDIGNKQFEICCIPFFLYDVSLGDIVLTSAKSDRNYLLEKVLKRSGRYVFRVWLGESNYSREELEENLESLGALTEWYSQNFLSIDAVDKEHAQIIANHLAEYEKAGYLVYETGRTQ